MSPATDSCVLELHGRSARAKPISSKRAMNSGGMPRASKVVVPLLLGDSIASGQGNEHLRHRRGELAIVDQSLTSGS
jgi:hypothetical protein